MGYREAAMEKKRWTGPVIRSRLPRLHPKALIKSGRYIELSIYQPRSRLISDELTHITSRLQHAWVQTHDSSAGTIAPTQHDVTDAHAILDFGWGVEP